MVLESRNTGSSPEKLLRLPGVATKRASCHSSRAGNHQLFWGTRIPIESQKLNSNSVRHPDQRIRDPPAPQPEAPNEGVKR